MHIEPGPIPTFRESAPASIKSFAASPVAMFPAMMSSSGKASLTIFTHLITLAECPCAESITMASTLALTKASTLSKIFAVTPTPAAHTSLSLASFAESGYLICFSISLIVISPVRLPSASTIGSFSFLAEARIFLASSSVMPSLAVTRPSLVIDSFIFLEKSVSNLRSLLVIIPTSFLPSVIGTPDILYLAITSLASAKVCSGDRKNGSVITPFSDLLTLSTSSA